MTSDRIHRDVFAELVNEAESRHKGPDIFWRHSGTLVDELRVLRRWNSHSPAVADVLGGGYFLRWQGKGTIIDPGCSFLRLFRHFTPYAFRDIDMVVVTHDHVDHCQDLGTLISLLRQYNKWLVKTGGEALRHWDMIVSYGIADQFISLLNHPDNAPFLCWRRVLAGDMKPIESPLDVPGFLKKAGELGLLDEYLRAFLKRATTLLAKKYAYEITALPAVHKELLGAATAFGLRLSLLEKDAAGADKKWPIVISGDTALCDEGDRVKHYGGAELLVLHVGSMEKPGERGSGDHLCSYGVAEILDAVVRGRPPEEAPRLVILTEWGYEFGRLGLNGRTQFTRMIADDLNQCAGLKGRFYAAVADLDGRSPREACPDGAVVLLPADIGLRIRLPDLHVFAGRIGAQGHFRDYHQVFAREDMEQIHYLPLTARKR